MLIRKIKQGKETDTKLEQISFQSGLLWYNNDNKIIQLIFNEYLLCATHSAGKWRYSDKTNFLTSWFSFLKQVKGYEQTSKDTQET